MSAHINEHSIEVQLPFLQFIFKKFKFVPIVVSSPFHLTEISEGIKKSISEYEKDILIIASSDFTHYGPNYDFVKFHDNIQQNITDLDMGAIEKIKAGDYSSFLEYIDETKATICGALPIAIMMKILNPYKTDLLKYYKSSDIMPDGENSVSYVSMVFK
jgi:AmmeMemoRadiSam system protein B